LYRLLRPQKTDYYLVGEGPTAGHAPEFYLYTNWRPLGRGGSGYPLEPDDPVFTGLSKTHVWLRVQGWGQIRGAAGQAQGVGTVEARAGRPSSGVGLNTAFVYNELTGVRVLSERPFRLQTGDILILQSAGHTGVGPNGLPAGVYLRLGHVGATMVGGPREAIDPDTTIIEIGETADGERTPVASPPVPPGSETRWITADVEGHDGSQALRLGDEYTLAFGVAAAPEAAFATELDEARVFRRGEELAELTVHLTSQDFWVHTPEPQRLRVPRRGRSKNKARFDIEAKREGVGQVSAVFYKDHNFIQDMTLRLRVGGTGAAVASVEARGRRPDGSFALRPRSLSLYIKRADDGAAFDVTMVGRVAGEARLPLTPEALAQMVEEVRAALRDVVYLGTSTRGVQVLPPAADLPPRAERVYQTGIDIPEAVNREALRLLARAGYRLYQRLFYDQNDANAALLGDRLRELARRETLKVQVVSEQFLIPWGVLYLAEDYDEERIDPERFLGLRHIV
jgi:hypothetical protein